MTVAYLIMAHEADAQLALLISTLLADERSRLYLHLDAKAGDLGAAAHLAADRLTVLDDRLVVNWGGYSIVAATQRLLARALREPTNTHFVLLSGSCFPLVPAKAANDRILAQATPVVAVWGRIDPDLRIAEGLGRYVVTKHHPLDIAPLNPKRGRMFERGWKLYQAINLRLPYERKVEIDDLWKGSQFFLIDRRLAEICVDPPAALTRAMRDALAPDEMFVTTLYVRDCRDRGTEAPLTSIAAHRQGLHYIRKQAPKNRSLYQKLFKPIDLRKLDESEIPAILASDALFTRKCGADLSLKIKQSWR